MVSKREKYLILTGGLLLFIGLFISGIQPAAAQSEGQISGIVYEDLNGNGIREEGEEGIKDVEVTFDSGGWSTTINTADNGTFSLGVNPATWTVSIMVPDGYTSEKTSTEVFIENPGDAVSNLEFALVPVADGEDGEGGDGDVLPESGGVVSGTTIVLGLVGVMVVGLALVVVGQRKSK